VAESNFICSLLKELDVSALKLPQGNSIQKYSKTALALLGKAVVFRSRFLKVRAFWIFL
jgi:hypothetical protein